MLQIYFIYKETFKVSDVGMIQIVEKEVLF